MKNNKKSANNSIIICILIILIIPTIASTVSAWDDCPFGEVNESYPGTCGRYIDTDGDNICDLSQPPPEDRDARKDEDKPNDSTNSSIGSNGIVTSSSSNTAGRINYFFIPIAVILLILYFISLTLSRKKKIKPSLHRKIWNLLLLITFLISGIFGILLAIIISYGIRLPYYSDLLFWHVEMGIAMTVISIFHIVWHRRYFIKMIPKKN